MKLKKLSMMIIGLAGALALPTFGQSTTSRVVFSLKTHSGGSQNRTITLDPILDPDTDDGVNIFWGPAVTVSPTNGIASVQLEPNSYEVAMLGKVGFTITVPTNGMTYRAVDLTTNLISYLGASNGPATVIFPLLTMTGGAQNRAMTISPLCDPVLNGTNIVWGTALSVTPTNGIATTALEPGGYQVTMPGLNGSMTIYVPTDGGTYNAASLPSTMPTAPTLTAPPAPTLNLTNDFGLIQTSNGTGDVGGTIQLYYFNGYIQVDSGPPVVTNYVGTTNLIRSTAWATSFDWSTNTFGTFWKVFATESGNGTNYVGESASSAWVFYSHFAP